MAEASYVLAASFAAAYACIILVCAVAYRWDRVILDAFRKMPYSGVAFL